MINHKYIYMNKILIIISLIIISCANPEKHQATTGHEHHDTTKVETAIGEQLNNGARWKTDEATRKNVGVLMKFINDSSHSDSKNRQQLLQKVQAAIDTLVRQCRMSGPDHDALHVWLKQVLVDVQNLKEGHDDEYQNLHTRLKNDIESFSVFFE